MAKTRAQTMAAKQRKKASGPVAGAGCGPTTVTRRPKCYAPAPLNTSTKAPAAPVASCEEPAKAKEQTVYLDARHAPSEYATIDRAAIVSRPSQSLVGARTGRIYGPAAPVRVRVIR